MTTITEEVVATPEKRKRGRKPKPVTEKRERTWIRLHPRTFAYLSGVPAYYGSQHSDGLAIDKCIEYLEKSGIAPASIMASK